MSAIGKILTISLIIILPMMAIRISNLELDVTKISDIGALAILLVPPLIVMTVKWLFEPSKKSHKSFSGGKDLFIKFHE